MKLDFSGLTPPTERPRGQAGTVGTQAFMRVPASPADRGDVGTSGDVAPAAAIELAPMAAVPAECPQASPSCPPLPNAHKPSVCAVSPVCPSVPSESAQIASAAAAQPEDKDSACELPGADADRWCWPRSDAMNTAELNAFTARTARFIARGIDDDAASALADQLVQRDRAGDDRRLCLECTWLGETGRCIAAANGRLPGADRRLEPVQTILQRCEAFGLRKGLS